MLSPREKNAIYALIELVGDEGTHVEQYLETLRCAANAINMSYSDFKKLTGCDLDINFDAEDDPRDSTEYMREAKRICYISGGYDAPKERRYYE
jgi:hypothetical protein